ncbi:magnesium/cobalt transporter CorA [Solitalea sp. MAHUQ-68]|uniref:Magnesium transport protein CorA n=1 Tax=Solitalea agri TaxID=2953739 RepID=A0A9X2F465_9SPHI|nr:magnesium/cobalt transporter CorA [Solitalea agri]MCO4294437.1 magnesium/cobalt transporter CorA [Solitalea agri]
MSSIVNCAAYADGKRVANIELNEIGQTLTQTDQFVWIGLHEPGEVLLSQVQREFGLHELAVEDAHRAHQRPKLEPYGDTFFIVLRTAQINNEQRRIDFGETHFFLGNNFIVTVRHGSSLSYTEVRNRCESTPQLLRKGPGFALYAVMDAIVDQYFPVIEALVEELEELEEKIFNETYKRETTAQIYNLKRQLLAVKHAVSPLTDICNRLMRFDSEIIQEDTRPYFRDVYDHSVRINEMVDNTRELLTTALEANFSLISISQNEISKKFAGWAAIIGVPTMIAGIYGMNFSFMPELHWHYGYPLALALTLGSCLTLYLIFKRSGWL